jgi:hypothetical protein
MRTSIAEHRMSHLVAALSVLLAFLVAACGSSTPSSTRSVAASLPPSPQVTDGDQREIGYLARATEVVYNHHKDCSPLQAGMHEVREVRDDGSPSQTMLSSFAVLKLPTKAAVPSGWQLSASVYVDYVRTAQTRFGWPFKVVPAAYFTTTSPYCLALEDSEVHTLTAHAPADVRAKVLGIEHDRQLDDRYIERHPEGICVSAYDHAALCEPLLYAIEQGATNAAIGRSTNPVSFDLVPNGVASITVQYGKQVGQPARTVNVPVIHNLAVWKVTSVAPTLVTNGESLGPTIVWRAANGRIIRTIPPRI